MTTVGKPERATQNRVIALFRDELGYDHLEDWTDRDENSNIEEGRLEPWLTRRGHTPEQIAVALHKLGTEAANHNRDLYGNNQAVYTLLRYGVPVKVEASQVTQTVRLIDWDTPENNDFALAEEVTLRGHRERRPDLVLYVNGIAVAVVELKSSRVSIGEGIRQLLSNQRLEFNAWFFSTVQFVFDGGVKKLPRVHQYFGIKAAQRHVCQKKGGIIWHTQGSGKSIVMVLLAKWILEDNPRARVAIITDRDELDKQIEQVFTGAGETMCRATSGGDLMNQLGQAAPRLLCSLVHKFGRRGVDDFEAFVKELEDQPSPTVGEVFVFVDECHRTQSGKLHRVMKALMPNAVFIGFTGTPLLKKDRLTSLEMFGGYIHTYKFSEGVEDGVVLALVYEARDIDQRLGSGDKIDAWFEAKTRGLNDWQKVELKKKWSTMQKVENAIAVYTSELDHSAGGADPEVLLQDRLKKGKERLDGVLEALALLCEPVEPPKGELEHIHYFCGNTELPSDLHEREPQRAALYKAVVALVRAYANVADELRPLATPPTLSPASGNSSSIISTCARSSARPAARPWT